MIPAGNRETQDATCRYLEAGMDEYLSKPVRAKQVAEKLSRFFGPDDREAANNDN